MNEQTTSEKLEQAKADWHKAKQLAGNQKGTPAYYAEVHAHGKVLDLQDQLEREHLAK